LGEGLTGPKKYLVLGVGVFCGGGRLIVVKVGVAVVEKKKKEGSVYTIQTSQLRAHGGAFKEGKPATGEVGRDVGWVARPAEEIKGLWGGGGGVKSKLPVGQLKA